MHLQQFGLRPLNPALDGQTVTETPERKEKPSSFHSVGASIKLLLELSLEDRGKLGTVAQALAVKAKEIFSLDSSQTILTTSYDMFFSPYRCQQIINVIPLGRAGHMSLSLHITADKEKQFRDLCEKHHFKLIQCETGELFPVEFPEDPATEEKVEKLLLPTATTPTIKSQRTQTAPSIQIQVAVTTPTAETQESAMSEILVDDVWPNILQHLPLRALLRLQRTSRKMQTMLNQAPLWTVRRQITSYLQSNSKQEFMDLFRPLFSPDRDKSILNLSPDQAIKAIRKKASTPGPEYPCKCCKKAGGMPDSHWYWRCPNLDTAPPNDLGETPRDILAKESKRFEKFVAVTKTYLVKGISTVRLANLGMLLREKYVYTEKTGLKPLVERGVEEGLLIRQGDQGIAEIVLLQNRVDRLIQNLSHEERAELIEWARTQHLGVGM